MEKKLCALYESDIKQVERGYLQNVDKQNASRCKVHPVDEKPTSTPGSSNCHMDISDQLSLTTSCTSFQVRVEKFNSTIAMLRVLDTYQIEILTVIL